MKTITRKNEILNYCIWYLNEVKEQASASEIVSYALENKLVGKSISLSSEMVAHHMQKSIFDKEKERGRLIYSLNPDFRRDLSGIK